MTITISRPTIYGNPCRVAIHMEEYERCPECDKFHTTPGSTLSCYRTYLERRITSDKDFRQAVINLGMKIMEGESLYCKGCGIDNPQCHGEILRKKALELLK